MVRIGMMPGGKAALHKVNIKGGGTGYMLGRKKIKTSLGEQMEKTIKAFERVNIALVRHATVMTRINDRVLNFSRALSTGQSIMSQSVGGGGGGQLFKTFTPQGLGAFYEMQQARKDKGMDKSVLSRFKSFGKHVKKTTKMIGSMVSSLFVGFSMIGGPMMSFLDSLGVLQPILDIISPILEIVGGAVMEALMPALDTLIQAITEPAFIDMLISIGVIIGAILTPIIEIFAELLKIVAPLIKGVAEIFGAILIPIFEAFKPVIKSLGPIFQMLGKLLEPIIPIIEFVAELIGKTLAYTFVIIGNVIIGVVNALITAINLFSWIIGVHLNYLPYIEMPSYARGGIALSDQIAMIDKGEKMIPLERQESEARMTEQMMMYLKDISNTNKILVDHKIRRKFKGG